MRITVVSTVYLMTDSPPWFEKIHLEIDVFHWAHPFSICASKKKKIHPHWLCFQDHLLQAQIAASINCMYKTLQPDLMFVYHSYFYPFVPLSPQSNNKNPANRTRFLRSIMKLQNWLCPVTSEHAELHHRIILLWTLARLMLKDALHKEYSLANYDFVL